jgi:hypothetical protein
MPTQRFLTEYEISTDTRRLDVGVIRKFQAPILIPSRRLNYFRCGSYQEHFRGPERRWCFTL